MFLKKLKSLLVFALVLLLTCSFTVLVNAEDSSEVTSAVSEAVSETQSAAESTSSEVSNVASEANSEAESAAVSEAEESDVDEAGTTSSTPSWLGWAIVGGIIIVIALWMFIIIKKNTPLGQKLVKFFKDYKSELKKVVWLSRKDLTKKTIVVLVMIIVACIVLGLLDYAFTNLISLIK